MKFSKQFPDKQIVAPLAQQLSWSHFLIVMPIKDELKREFYLTMAASERWSKRTLKDKIDGMLFERTAIAGKPEELIRNELYLRWLEKYEMEPGEETPIGLLLCTEGGDEQIELLQLDKTGIKVAQYMTELPPREVLVNHIQKSLAEAKAKFDNNIAEVE